MATCAIASTLTSVHQVSECARSTGEEGETISISIQPCTSSCSLPNRSWRRLIGLCVRCVRIH
ncbi:hypothetical protein C8Q74DRAFT_1242544 [Fomes fomentarius]|nr:hypothetical protein C8Q74DRAFT_1242544 [Fomes fomentarius]